MQSIAIAFRSDMSTDVEAQRATTARRADALLEAGYVEGQRVWKGVLRAVEELARVDRKAGEGG